MKTPAETHARRWFPKLAAFALSAVIFGLVAGVGKVFEEVAPDKLTQLEEHVKAAADAIARFAPFSYSERVYEKMIFEAPGRPPELDDPYYWSCNRSPGMACPIDMIVAAREIIFIVKVVVFAATQSIFEGESLLEWVISTIFICGVCAFVMCADLYFGWGLVISLLSLPLMVSLFALLFQLAFWVGLWLTSQAIAAFALASGVVGATMYNAIAKNVERHVTEWLIELLRGLVSKNRSPRE